MQICDFWPTRPLDPGAEAFMLPDRHRHNVELVEIALMGPLVFAAPETDWVSGSGHLVKWAGNTVEVFWFQNNFAMFVTTAK